ncbi:MAG: hypothetical protein ACRC7H_03920 [Plesiomonas shigelloides]|uniref:hypothetical protein n=1 Tax=Cetobacterium sp. TaxID=2071632 RepID=UPI003EE5D0F1
MNPYFQIGISNIREIYKKKLLQNPLVKGLVDTVEGMDSVVSQLFPSSRIRFLNTDIFIKKGKLYADGVVLIHFPVVPTEISVSGDGNSEEVNTPMGLVTFLDKHGLQEISWSSFFPADYVSFSKNQGISEWEAVSIIENLRKTEEPIDLIITGTEINLTVSITNFTYTQSANGNIEYNLSFKEFIYPKEIPLKEDSNSTYYKPQQTQEKKIGVKYSNKDGKPQFSEYKSIYNEDFLSNEQ